MLSLYARLKRLDVLDMALIKLAIACFVIALLVGFKSLYYAFEQLPWWIYLVLALVFAARPQIKAWGSYVVSEKKSKKKK